VGEHSVGIILLSPQRSFILAQRLVDPALTFQNHAEQIKSLHECAPVTYYQFGFRLNAGKIAAVQPDVGEIVVSLGIAGIYAERGL
jgi:hypothetical protein